MLYALTVALIAILVIYVYGLFWTSRRPVALRERGDVDDLFFIFVIPCLNEEAAIGASLARLLNLPARNYVVVVVDDASDDATASIVERLDDDRVRLLRRLLPDARHGKGDALNAAYAFIVASEFVRTHDAKKVIVVVLDSDGHLESNALAEVAPYFGDADVGAVQISVRMYNAADGLLERMQDFEFVTFTELFQRSRSRVGTAGLGGNGQFTRLSALIGLGDRPWSDVLTEDLDLGLKLICAGWQNLYCSSTFVSQEAVTDLAQLVRQRARWFQGHLQCWRRLRDFGSIEAPRRAVLGLIHHLLAPVLILVISIPVVVVFVTTLILTATVPDRVGHMLASHDGLAPIMWYALAFSTALPFSIVYHQREATASWPRSVLYAHLFIFYNYVWFFSGWTAIWKMLTRRRDWAKTAHLSDTPGVGRTRAPSQRQVAPLDQVAVDDGPSPAEGPR